MVPREGLADGAHESDGREVTDGSRAGAAMESPAERAGQVSSARESAATARDVSVPESATHDDATRSVARSALARAARDASLRVTLYTFTLTRLLVLAILIVGGQASRVAAGSGEGTREMYLSLARIPVARVLRETVLTADANWYQGIAERGYEQTAFNADAPHNWAFFPLFPLLWRLAARLTGEFALTGVALSHLFFFVALFCVHRAALAYGFTRAVADRALFLLAVSPTSYFFSLPLTESLYLLLTAGSLYLARRGRWWTACVLGALASATRIPGVLLLPALLVLHWQAHGRGAWRRRELLALCLVPSGLVCFMYYLHATTGDALAFKHIMVTWGRRTGFFLAPLWDYARDPLLVAAPWDFRLVNFACATLALVCGAWLLKWRQWALGLYTLASVLVALSSVVLQSQARYAMVLFPVYLVLAAACEGRPRLDETLRFVSLALLCLLTALFAAHFSAALS